MARIYLHESVKSCPFLGLEASIMCWDWQENDDKRDVCMGIKRECASIMEGL